MLTPPGSLPPWKPAQRLEFRDGVALLAYQVLEDQRLVMTRHLLWAPTTPGGLL
jgi:hypothetical protein